MPTATADASAEEEALLESAWTGRSAGQVGGHACCLCGRLSCSVHGSVQLEWLERPCRKSCAGCSCSQMFHIRHGGWLGEVELGMPASNVEPAASAHICTLVSYPANALSRVSLLCFALQFSSSAHRFKRLLAYQQPYIRTPDKAFSQPRLSRASIALIPSSIAPSTARFSELEKGCTVKKYVLETVTSRTCTNSKHSRSYANRQYSRIRPPLATTHVSRDILNDITVLTLQTLVCNAPSNLSSRVQGLPQLRPAC